jgi:hypothetical protein
MIKKTKQQLIEKDRSTKTLRNKWYDEECKIAIEEMKKASEKWLIKGGENEEQEYYHEKKEAHTIIRNKKKVYMKKCNRINRRRSKA